MKQDFLFETSKTQRLDEFLRAVLPQKIEGECSNSKIRRLITAGAVSVNGRQIIRPAFELRGRSTVAVAFDPQKFFFEKQPDDIKFEVTDKSVLYEDENLIFINKPPFFPVEQTITGNRANLHDAVVDYLWKRNPELRNPPYVGIMHRLDRETSGVILFTKNRAINKPVSQMFQEHNFQKEYTAVVTESAGKNVPGGTSSSASKNMPRGGQLSVGQKFTVENYLGRISGKSQAGKWGSVLQKQGGLYAKTEFEVTGTKIINGKTAYILRCILFTGRTHQIRVHLSEAGLPIVGDKLYGGIPYERMMLHSSLLACETEELAFCVKASF